MSAAAPQDAFSGIFAQDLVLRTLRHAVQNERIASAYLFEGPSGVGKERVALALAKTVIGADSARRIDEGKHPDVRIFHPRDEGHRNIKVEMLRDEILPYAEFAPFEAKSAFLVFPEADVSFPANHPGSANALLKTLEEPKPGVTFILLAERPDRLLPTIRSRCQSVRFSRLPIEAIEKLLGDSGVEPGLARSAAALSGGRADRALQLCEDDAASELLDFAMRIDAATRGTRPGALLDVAEELVKRKNVGLALEGLSLFYRDLVRIDLGFDDDALAFRSEAAQMRERARSTTASQASGRAGLLRQASEALEANGNRQVVLDSLMFRLRQVH